MDDCRYLIHFGATYDNNLVLQKLHVSFVQVNILSANWLVGNLHVIPFDRVPVTVTLLLLCNNHIYLSDATIF